MTAPVPALAAGTLAEDVFKKFMTAQSIKLVRGVVACVKKNGTDADVIDADDAQAGAIVGLVMSGGPMTAGVYGAPALGDPLTIQRFGQAVGLLDINQTITRGDKLGVVAGTGGRLGAYIPGQGMRFVGFAAQSKTTGGVTPLYLEVDLHSNPKVIHAMMVSGFIATTFQGATKFMSAPGTGAGSATQVVLGVVPAGGGILANLMVNESTAPGGADTDTFTVQKSSDNGANWTDTTLTAQIAAAAKAASDVAHTPAVAAGDLLAIKVVGSAGTLGAGKAASFQLIQQP